MPTSGFNAVDAVVLVWLLMGGWHGARHGMTGELGRLLAAVLAGFVAWQGCGWLGEQLLATGRLSTAIAHAAAFMLMLIAAYILLRLMSLLLKHLATFTFKGRLEPLGGTFLGLLSSTLLVTVLLFVLGRWPDERLRRWFAEDSACGRVVQPQLAPLYQRLTARYPALRIPESAEPAGDSADMLQNQTTAAPAAPKAPVAKPRP
ncbi:MAG: CvpA family protein [Kiritimatiellaeota bacterium]|nr:CvpA family protein [Kiritimatiellota bacterium]